MSRKKLLPAPCGRSGCTRQMILSAKLLSAYRVTNIAGLGSRANQDHAAAGLAEATDTGSRATMRVPLPFE